MGVFAIAIPPIVCSTCLIPLELFIRRRQKSGYFANGWFFAINVLLCSSCIILAGMALGLDPHEKETLKEQLLLLSFQTLWIQSAILNIYHLRKVLFEIAFKPWIGFVGLSIAAVTQLAGAVLCMYNTVPSRRDLERISAGCLHGGWALYHTVFLSWICWILSRRGTKNFLPQIFKDRRVFWLFFSPPVSTVVGAIPFSLILNPPVAFLIVCIVQWLLCTIPPVLSWFMDKFIPRSTPNFNTLETLMDESIVANEIDLRKTIKEPRRVLPGIRS